MKADYKGWGEGLVELLGHVKQTDMWYVLKPLGFRHALTRH